MRRFAYAFFALLATGTLSLADPPKPGGPYRAAVGELVEIEIQTQNGKLGFHNPYAATELFIREVVPRRKDVVSYLVQTRQPKTYYLTVWTAGETVGETLVIDSVTTPVPPTPIPPNPKPGPTPPPDPKPTPTPTPITSDHWFIVVEETSQRTPEIAQLLDFKKWDTLGVKYRFYDPNSPDVKAQGYDKLVAQLKLKPPVLFVFDKAGNVIDARELPRTFEEIQKIKTGKVPPPPPPPADNPPVYRDSSQLRVRNEQWGNPPSFNIVNVVPQPSKPVGVQANPFGNRPAQDFTLATTAQTAAGANTRFQGTMQTGRTTIGVPLAGQFGITNCVSG